MRTRQAVVDHDSIAPADFSRTRINNTPNDAICFNDFLVSPFLLFRKNRRSCPVISINKSLRGLHISVDMTPSFDISGGLKNVSVLFLNVHFLCNRIGFNQLPDILDFYGFLNLRYRTPIIP